MNKEGEGYADIPLPILFPSKGVVIRVLLIVVVSLALLIPTAALAANTKQDITNLSNTQLYKESQKEIAKGGIYSHRWGDASYYLKSICYEMIRRQFTPYGTQEWARYVVNRESGCNPAAVNTTYSSWNQQAKGIAQLIPAYHTWVNYSLYMRDLKYAVAVFARLSRNGSNIGPWTCC